MSTDKSDLDRNEEPSRARRGKSKIDQIIPDTYVRIELTADPPTQIESWTVVADVYTGDAQEPDEQWAVHTAALAHLSTATAIRLTQSSTALPGPMADLAETTPREVEWGEVPNPSYSGITFMGTYHYGPSSSGDLALSLELEPTGQGTSRILRTTFYNPGEGPIDLQHNPDRQIVMTRIVEMRYQGAPAIAVSEYTDVGRRSS